MPVAILTKELVFPPAASAEPGGLLAIGGDLSVERLLLAYKNGIFPWYDEEPICWYCPDPRFILFPENLKISKTARSLLQKNAFTFSINKAFRDVMLHCKTIVRTGQRGTWINEDLQHAFYQLHKMGYAHSAEVWKEDELVGGLYGIRMGNVFFGESMFSKISNASRYAFIKYLQHLQDDGVQLIDCQVYTSYLESFGAEMIAGNLFDSLLKKLIP